MGNQVCSSDRDPNSQESVRNRSFNDINNYKSLNQYVLQDKNNSEFPELPTLSDEVSSLKRPQYQDIHDIKIKASVARKRKPPINKPASTNGNCSQNQSLRSINVEENQDNFSSRDIHYGSQPNTFRSEQTVFKTTRHYPSNSLSDFDNQTNRRPKQNIIPIALCDKDEYKENCKTSRKFKENIQVTEDSFRDFREANSTRREKKVDIFQNKKVTFSNHQILHEQNTNINFQRPQPEVSDPISSYLRKFTENKADTLSHNRNRHMRSISMDNNISLPMKPSNNIYPRGTIADNSKQILKVRNENIPEMHDELSSPGKNIVTFGPFDSPQIRITSESTLLSEPSVNEASQFVPGTRRLWDYEVSNKLTPLNFKRLVTDAQGLKNLTSITEFDRLQIIEEQSFLNEEFVSHRYNDSDRKRGSMGSIQSANNSGRYKSSTYTNEDTKDHNPSMKIQASMNSARSNISASSSVAATMKNDPCDKPFQNNYYTQNQRHPKSLELLSYSSNPLDNRRVDRNDFGRISTVSECFQETDQSLDSLNRTGELSMMSPTNIESPNTSFIANKRRSPSPPRRSLRQHVLAKALKKSKKLNETQEVEIMEDSMKSGFLSYGQKSNDPLESLDNDLGHTNSTCSDPSMPRESLASLQAKPSAIEPGSYLSKNSNDANYNSSQASEYDSGKLYVRRYSSPIDYTELFDKVGNKKCALGTRRSLKNYTSEVSTDVS